MQTSHTKWSLSICIHMHVLPSGSTHYYINIGYKDKWYHFSLGLDRVICLLGCVYSANELHRDRKCNYTIGPNCYIKAIKHKWSECKQHVYQHAWAWASCLITMYQKHKIHGYNRSVLFEFTTLGSVVKYTRAMALRAWHWHTSLCIMKHWINAPVTLALTFSKCFI